MNQLTPIKVDALEKVEALIATLKKFRVDIENALVYSDDSHSFNDVVAMVFAGKVDLYALPNSVILMEYNKYPNHAVYHGYIAAGDLQEILGAHAMIEAEARKRKCKYLTIAGRRGWEKPMKEHGWVHSLTIMKKEVPNV